MSGTVLLVANKMDPAFLEAVPHAELLRASLAPAELLETSHRRRASLLVVDTRAMAGAVWPQLIEYFRAEGPAAVRIVAIVPALQHAAERALNAGADDYIHIGARPEETRLRLDVLLQQARNQPQRDDRYPSEELFTHSAQAPGMGLMNENGTIVSLNQRALQTLPGGVVKSERQNFLDLVTVAERQRVAAMLRSCRRNVFPKDVDICLASGEPETVINLTFYPAPRGNGEVLFTFRDVTTERAIARELTQAREFLERVIESSVDAIVAADLSGQVLLFNRAAARIFGYPPEQVVKRMNVENLYPPGIARAVMRLIRDNVHGGEGRVEGFNVNMQDSQGHHVPVRISAALIYENGVPSGSVGIFRDIREEVRMAARLKEAQETVRHHEKEAAVAQLAGATAHELNQPLTVVLTYAELLSMRLPEDSPLAEIAHVISEQAERMANIVRHVGRITRYETKSYVGSAQILDLERSSKQDPEDG